ncbi:uncharacterized protein LOC127122601 [Lathyrus oleraceus]|uniref:uncharacterized protein LOC127122601 n=1 Tax=Pisum sativum TaxID=3888 RepID=UPI0021D3771F|nr:uncharacterized protein LOC127122601 [Pisum sativum]
MNKEKGKDKEEVRKSITIKTSSSKSSKDEHSHCEERNDKNYDDDDFGLFVNKYQRYIRKNRVKDSKINLAIFRKESKSLKADENKKGKFRSSCYNCGEVGHYRPECLIIKKDREKWHDKKSRREYVASDSSSDSSSDESSTSSV